MNAHPDSDHDPVTIWRRARSHPGRVDDLIQAGNDMAHEIDHLRAEVSRQQRLSDHLRDALRTARDAAQ